MRRAEMVVPAGEEKMVKQEGVEEMAEMLQSIATERMVKMVLEAESKFHVFVKQSQGLTAPDSGGYGSNGADGAAAGNVFITVHDDDTDLLVPLEYDVRGGAGGASGQHGEPGDGGIGGRGGRSHSW
jgi:hypothetical protein